MIWRTTASGFSSGAKCPASSITMELGAGDAVGDLAVCIERAQLLVFAGKHQRRHSNRMRRGRLSVRWMATSVCSASLSGPQSRAILKDRLRKAWSPTLPEATSRSQCVEDETVHALFARVQNRLAARRGIDFRVGTSGRVEECEPRYPLRRLRNDFERGDAAKRETASRLKFAGASASILRARSGIVLAPEMSATITAATLERAISGSKSPPVAGRPRQHQKRRIVRQGTI